MSINRTRILIFAFTAVLIVPSGYAGCTAVYGLVQPSITGCDYNSHIWEVCYQGNTYGYAYMEVVHTISADIMGQVHWNHVPWSESCAAPGLP